MRGTHGLTKVPIPRLGITPAYAGNTTRIRCLSELVRDHPRVCGEHNGVMRMKDNKLGSPPRMRGTLMGRWVQR